ncbi:MAG TPA: hypothetical protein PK264_22660 [Hyphomicrobiaceae bacterium]|nr:hypothetical protein [Hyphomicrobiaceae bacterium]
MAQSLGDLSHDARSPVPASLRLLMAAEAFFVLVAGATLYCLPAETNKYFAWTIQPSLTAAMLGAAYVAAFALQVSVLRQARMIEARVGMPAVSLFATLGLAATLLHIDRFHFQSPEPTARLFAIVWLLVYVLVPIVSVWLLRPWWRALWQNVPGREPLAGAMFWNLMILGMMLSLAGIIMLLSPQGVIPNWPWRLTPLTARMLGAWSVGIGFALIQAARLGDEAQVRPAAPAIIVLSVLSLIALARFSDQVAWGTVTAVVILVVLINLFVVAVIAVARPMNNRAARGLAQ